MRNQWNAITEWPEHTERKAVDALVRNSFAL